ncbi:MAG: hypothetical protein ACTSQA_08020 [Candidatus Heimdallarchaeaceae archaeon]
MKNINYNDFANLIAHEAVFSETHIPTLKNVHLGLIEIFESQDPTFNVTQYNKTIKTLSEDLKNMGYSHTSVFAKE